MYSTATIIPPFRLLQADYPSTILGIQFDNSTVIILRNFTDAFHNSDCADALLQNPQITLDDSANILRINCGLLTRQICRYHKASCDMHRIYCTLITVNVTTTSQLTLTLLGMPVLYSYTTVLHSCIFTLHCMLHE